MSSTFKFFLTLISFYALAAASSHASEINCTIDWESTLNNDVNYSALLVDVVRGTCEKGAYQIELSGIGLGLRIAVGTVVGISCPFSDKITGTYGGVKADLSVAVGLDAGLFVGPHGLCALGGVNGLSIGINLSGSRLKITGGPSALNDPGKSPANNELAMADGDASKTAPGSADPQALPSGSDPCAPGSPTATPGQCAAVGL